LIQGKKMFATSSPLRNAVAGGLMRFKRGLRWS
jgi:hypothetical protein